MEQLQAFMDLFGGLERAHGTYEVTSSRSDNKQTGKAATLQKPVTKELWQLHLEGKRSLGVIPINDDSMCKFGAIDIDKYDNLSHKMLVELLAKHHLPLIVCRSKSGGAHLYALTKEWVPARLMQEKLKEIASALGYGTCEIFPKQTEILAERGDIGQWINMPYFGGDSTNRYGVDAAGQALSTADFISHAFETRISVADFESLSITTKSEIEDGPPCLQHLVTQGFPEGTRNDGLFALGVYYRKSDPDGWERKVDDANAKYLQPPLSSDEVGGVKKGLRKKDYNYACSKPPIVSHCNSAVCRLRKFGVGPSSSMPLMTSLTKFDSNPPIWFVDVEGSGRLELTTEELQSQTKFQKRCMDALNMMPMPVKNLTWVQMINHLMENATIIEAPEDASAEGQFLEHLHAFCNGKARARTKEEIYLGKPWFDEVEGRVFFRMKDLISYLDRHHFREFRVHKLTSILKQKGLIHRFIHTNGIGFNTWGLKIAEKKEELPVPREVTDATSNY